MLYYVILCNNTHTYIYIYIRMYIYIYIYIYISKLCFPGLAPARLVRGALGGGGRRWLGRRIHLRMPPRLIASRTWRHCTKQPHVISSLLRYYRTTHYAEVGYGEDPRPPCVAESQSQRGMRPWPKYEWPLAQTAKRSIRVVKVGRARRSTKTTEWTSEVPVPILFFSLRCSKGGTIIYI